MDIYDLINDFLEHLEIEAGRSKRTVENYRLYLERFVEISLDILNKDEMKAIQPRIWDTQRSSITLILRQLR